MNHRQMRGYLLDLSYEAFEALLRHLEVHAYVPGPVATPSHRVEELLDLLGRQGRREILEAICLGRDNVHSGRAHDPLLLAVESGGFTLATGPWRERRNPVQLVLHRRGYVMDRSIFCSMEQVLLIEQQQAHDEGYELHNGDIASLFAYDVKGDRLTLHLRRAKFYDFLVTHPLKSTINTLRRQDPDSDLFRWPHPRTAPFSRDRANLLTFILNVVTADSKIVVGRRAGNLREYAWHWDAVIGTAVTPQMVVSCGNPYDVARSMLARDFTLDDDTLSGTRIDFDSLIINRDNNEPDLLGTARLPLTGRELVARARATEMTGFEVIDLTPRRIDSFLATARRLFTPNSLICVTHSIRSFLIGIGAAPHDKDNHEHP